MNSKLKAMAWDYGRTFLAALITAFLMLNKPIFDLSVEDWKAVVSAAVASFLPVILSALNRKDTRYGMGSAPVGE